MDSSKEIDFGILKCHIQSPKRQVRTYCVLGSDESMVHTAIRGSRKNLMASYHAMPAWRHFAGGFRMEKKS